MKELNEVPVREVLCIHENALRGQIKIVEKNNRNEVIKLTYIIVNSIQGQTHKN